MKDFLLQLGTTPSTTGAECIVYQNEVYDVLFDGELYNEDSLFDALINEYPVLHETTSIVFFAYQKWGLASMEHMEGGFSFAIVKGNEAFIAKDPMGLRPIFYTQYNGVITISNTIRDVLKYSKRPAILQTDGLLELFAFGPGTSEDKTLFANIYGLPMGCCMEIKNNDLRVVRYYQLPLYEHKDSLEETTARVHELLCDSIQKQSVNCEASYLSGGLDSSIITAVCAKNKNNWKTYSLDYEGNKENFKGNMYQVSLDNEYIEEMIQRYGCNHTSYLLKQSELVELLDDAMRARDLPGMADVDSALLWLCKQTSKTERNVMSGECSDEIFGGYPWFYRDELKDLDTFPWLRSTDAKRSLLNENIKNLDFEGYIQTQYHTSISNVNYLDSDTNEDRSARLHTYLCLHWFMQTLVTRQVVEGDLGGVNIRAPFANVKLLEYAYNIPWDMKFYNQQEKGILRKAFEKELPHDVCWRKKNPFPKTHNPKYADFVAALLKKRFDNPQSPLHVLFDDHMIEQLIETKGASFQLPWYGQLMSGPQLLAYLYQLDCWIQEYNVKLEF